MGEPRDLAHDLRANVGAVAAAMAERHLPTRQHCDRVAGLARDLGRICCLSSNDLQRLVVAASLHDIGKIGVPDSVLNKPGRFDSADWAIMRPHTEKGERIVLATAIDDARELALAVRHHHERFDGSGYPDGLRGEDIPVLARMIAIADTYDAMTCQRPYRPPHLHAQVLIALQAFQGAQHDPYLVSKFLSAVETSDFRAP
jgi:HD-GYP domain-containing protein (c-di-GMP phosphodiesterase class II)